jgi:hypothetical protein
MADFRPATCHPDKPLVARGLCARCYTQERKQKQLDDWPDAGRERSAGGRDFVRAKEALGTALQGATDGLSLEDAIRATKRELIQALPEAARALRVAIASDPHRGQSIKAASLLLRSFRVDDHEVTTFLQGSHQQNAPAPAGAQIVVGLHVSGGKDEQPRLGRVVGTVGPSIHPKRPNKDPA